MTRKRKWRSMFGLFALVSVAVSAAAQQKDFGAPPDQYKVFTRDSTEIVDLQTGLTWERVVLPGGEMIRTVAQAHCDGLKLGPNPNDAGPPARIPTVKELLTLVDERPHPEYENGAEVQKHIDSDPFPKTPVNLPYWTSTPGPNAGEFWTVDFATGNTAPRAGASAAYVRCVL